jgi:hypothetical protein
MGFSASDLPRFIRTYSLSGGFTLYPNWIESSQVDYCITLYALVNTKLKPLECLSVVFGGDFEANNVI